MRSKSFKMLVLITCLMLAFSIGNFVHAEAIYKPGVYIGLGDGRNGPIKLEVTFSESEIVSINTIEHQETEGIADVPFARIPEEIVKNQSLKIDAIATATMTSNAIVQAVANAVEQAGGDVQALKSMEVAKAGPRETVNRTADVIVLGGGGAGVAAAYSAAELGASVIVVEKTAALGGNTMRSGGYFNSVIPDNQKALEITAGQIEQIENYCQMDPRNDTMKNWQEKLAEEFEAYKDSGSKALFDSVYLHMIQTYVDGDYIGNPELIEAFCANAPNSYTWLEDMGFDWKDNSIVIVGSLWPRSNMSKSYRSGLGFIDVIKNKADEKQLPIEYDLEVEAKELKVTNGKVDGVKAIGVDGTEYIYHANKGVIIATGGFGANVEMRVKYNSIWANLGPNVPTTNSPAITGDGILMAQEVGANLVGMDKIQLLIADPVTGETSTNVGDTTSIYLNQEGKRYVNETSRRDVLCASTLEQTNSMMYIISSFQNSRLDNDFINTYGLHLNDLVERKAVFTSDTLEGLAEQIGVDPDTLVKTVADYNAAIDAGYDELTGRRIFNATAKIEENGPYFANPRAPAVHHTMGGIEVDVSARVLDEKGNVIPGLYAAGEVTGGFHGGNRLGGNAISEVITTGRVAGISVVDDNK